MGTYFRILIPSMGTRWLLTAALLFGFVHQALTQTCNGDAMQIVTVGDNQVCVIQNKTRVSWDDARKSCRSKSGALPNTTVVYDKRFNGLNNFWSGYFKQDNQVMLERAVLHRVEWNQVGIDKSQIICGLFIRQSNGNGYKLEWKKCDKKKKFICEVPDLDFTPSPTKGTLITSTESTKGNNGTFLWGTTRVSNNGNYTTKNPESPITRLLHDLSQSFEERDVPKVAEELRNLTSEVQPEDAVEKDVILIADTLQEITNISKKLPQSTVQNLLDTVSKVSRFPESSLGGTQNGSGATTRILHTIDKLGALLKIEEDQTHKRIVSEGFGLEVWDIDKLASDEDTVIGIKVLAEGDKKLNESEKLVTQFSNTIVDNSDSEAAIYLPKEILKHYTGREGSPKVRLVMNVYRDTSLYEHSASDSEEVEGVNITLNSRVIAAQLLVNGQQITNLTDHKVSIVFKPKESKGRPQCAFWDFSANLTQGHWNTSGCKYRDRVDGRDVCECDHLTNFAVLVSFKSQSTLEHTEALGYITLIGLILSIFGLTISILSFLCIKKLRQGRPQQTMFQLSVALLLSWVVFLAGVNRTSDHTGCVVVAALLHYLILASFMWMLMEAVVQFLLFVRVMNPHISYYMLKMGLPSWGVPVIPVVITLSIDPDLYIGGPKYCWMSRQVFYYGFALPVGIIISANLVIFFLIC
ncbi:hypothetical protein RRG08_056435, partial [Elysia crispata]